MAQDCSMGVFLRMFQGKPKATSHFEGVHMDVPFLEGSPFGGFKKKPKQKDATN